MLVLIKKSMRISHDKLDDVLQSDIDTCLLDLKRAGIVKIEEADKLIIKLTELYCKWQEDFQGKGDIYGQSYEKMRDGVSLCGDYNV